MAKPKAWRIARLDWQSAEHSARTAIAALLSIIVARALRLPEYYWAPITTLVVMQSTLGAALTISGERIIGTALGAAAGALLAPHFGSSIIAFAAAVLVLGLICGALGVGRSAYRFSGITLAIVVLISRSNAAWTVATHRFIEVAIGVAVGLAVTAVWPEGKSEQRKRHP